METSKRIFIISAFGLIVSLVLCFVAFTPILEYMVKDQTSLRDRNFVKKIYLKIPFPLNFCVYFFNSTNPDDVLEGDKPKLKEIGPYCYNAYKEKIDIDENEGEDSLTYTPYETYFFNPEKSGELTDEDYVTVLHPLIMGIVNKVADESPPLLPIVQRALGMIFDHPRTVYVTMKVKDLLFDGMEIRCDSKDFPTQAVCAQLKTQLPALRETKEDVFMFGLLGMRNGTLPLRIKVLRGQAKSKELGKVVEVNHEKTLDVWESAKCNQFKGTDGWIFPPLIDRNEGINVLSTEICKSMTMVFQEEIDYKGLKVEKYYADIGDTINNTKESCYCLMDKCLPKGVLDLTKCMGTPVLATLPHFLRTEDFLRDQVEGMKPETEQHINRILMDPLLGVPLEAQKRMQINLPIQPIEKIDFMKNLPKAIHPIFWLEESIQLEGSLFSLIRSVFLFLKVFYYVKFALVGVFLMGILFGIGVYMKNRRIPTITPVHDPVIKIISGRSPQKYEFAN